MNRGGKPKCKIQLNLAPIRTTKSAYFKAVDLAALIFNEWESGTTPFPIGVGKNGIWELSTSFLI